MRPRPHSADDVDAAEAFGGRVAELDERVEVADVAGTRDDALEPQVTTAAGREAEVAAAVVEHARDRSADAAARSSDQRGLAIQIGQGSSMGLRVG
jgi:hypothetical protein